jgi:hypothetical protein
MDLAKVYWEKKRIIAELVNEESVVRKEHFVSGF